MLLRRLVRFSLRREAKGRFCGDNKTPPHYSHILKKSRKFTAFQMSARGMQEMVASKITQYFLVTESNPS
jgi:hypothetical protein